MTSDSDHGDLRAQGMPNELREWYATTLESIGDAVIATDERGRVVFMNRIAEHLTGWTVASARGHQCAEIFQIVNEETRSPVESPLAKALIDGAVQRLANNTLLITARGDEIPIDDSGAPIQSRSGHLLGAVLVFRDVSERRRAEQERRQAVAEAEELLARERVARAESERAIRVKDEFLATVSHELRTPINAILGWSHVLTQPEVPPEVVQQGVDVIARNLRLQAQLISDLMDVSSIVSGKLRLHTGLVDPCALFADVVQAAQASARDKGIDVLLQSDSDVGMIVADRSRLHQVAWNLLWNAIKFTPAGGSVTVRIERRETKVDIAVSDTGIGIPREFLPRIFERFEQRDESITREFGGLGLGLSIVKRLVEMHHGSVSAASEGEGKGATFTVILPAAGPAVDDVDAVTMPKGSAKVVATLDGIEILVVEDDVDTLQFLKRYLVSCGARVVLALSGTEALEVLPRTHADVVVSDIGLPGMDGYELIQRIRTGNLFNGVPAIALTAYTGPSDRARAFRAGFQAHLPKPIEPPVLSSTIARFVAPRSA